MIVCMFTGLQKEMNYKGPGPWERGWAQYHGGYGCHWYTGTSPACQEVTGIGPSPWVQVQTFVSG